MSVAVDRPVVDAFVVDTLVGFGVDRSAVNDQASFDELEVDSLDLAELRQAVRKEFGLDLRPADFDRILTVGEALALIYQRAGLD